MNATPLACLLRRVLCRLACHLDLGVRAGEEQSFVPIAIPAHDVRRGAVWAPALDDFAAPLDLADLVTVHDQVVSNRRLHVRPPTGSQAHDGPPSPEVPDLSRRCTPEASSRRRSAAAS